MVKLDSSRVVSKNEQDFVLEALQENLRMDDRSFTQFRRLSVNFGRKSGSVDISLGRTRVLANVRCRAVEPSVYRPKEGFLDFNLSVSPMADPMYVAGRVGKSEIEELKRLLDRVLKVSKAVDVESLCLLPGKMVWSIRVDITIVDYDGNATDACSIAALSALLHFRRPEVTIRGGSVTIHPESERQPVPLNVQHVPIVVTFGIMPGCVLLADPSNIESSVSTGELSVAVNTLNQVCVIHKVGGASVPQTDLMHAIRVAANKVEYIVERITEKIAEDEVKRKKAGLAQFAWAKDRQSVGEMEKIAKGIEKAKAKQAEAVPEADTKRRTRSLSPDDPDVQVKPVHPAKKAKKEETVTLTSRANLTLCVPDGDRKKKEEAAAGEEEVEEVEEVEEIEEIEEVEEDDAAEDL